MRLLHTCALALALAALSVNASLIAQPQPLATRANSPYRFPPYRQCDPRWGPDVTGASPSTATICEAGSLLTSVSAMLAGVGASWMTPAVLNPFLKEQRAFEQCHGGNACAGMFNVTFPERLYRGAPAIGPVAMPPIDNITANTVAGTVLYIAILQADKTNVLVTGTTGGNLTFWNPKAGVWSGEPLDSFLPYAFAFHRDKYPMYKQCNPLWGSDVMGGDGDTICEVGCLMTSITMALAGTNITIAGQTALPNGTNKFLQTHNGFVPGSSSLYESVIPQINPARIQWPADGMHPTNDLPFSTITEYIDRATPRIVIANVMHGQHFVLVTGYRNDQTTLLVNDPGFDKATYDYHNDVVGWRIFDMEM